MTAIKITVGMTAQGPNKDNTLELDFHTNGRWRFAIRSKNGEAIWEGEPDEADLSELARAVKMINDTDLERLKEGVLGKWDERM